jgi:hypothetical protein
MPRVLSNAKPTLAELQYLCDPVDGIYVSKSGTRYINALSEIFGANNTNDIPFTRDDVISQPKIQDFNFTGKNDFIYTATLVVEPMTIHEGRRKNEKIIVSEFANETQKDIFNRSMGVAYMITCVIDEEEYIVKFGQTRTPFKKRLGSYNCGVVFNWRTASTTNIKMLQSFVVTRAPFKVYLYKPLIGTQTYTFHGITSVPFASSESLAVEDITIQKFIEQFGHKPLANVQANATISD